MNTIFSLPMDIYKNRRLVAKLAKNDFKTRYAGSYLGIVWAFIQPVITILVYWFVFSVGFRSGTGDLGVPFVLYLVAGIVPWFFFQDALMGGTNSLLEYNYLMVSSHCILVPVTIAAKTMMSGNTNARSTACSPSELCPHNWTSSFIWNFPELSGTSMIFSLLSDAVHILFAWHPEQADCWMILT